jgi:hypothetical protein
VLLAYDNKTGRYIHSTGSMAGKAYFNYYKILGFFNLAQHRYPGIGSTRV